MKKTAGISTLKQTVGILIFTLNEIDGMKEIMPKIPRHKIDQIVIVDGGSTDGTVEYAEEHGYYIFRQKQKGTVGAFYEGMRKINTDIVIVFSPDGNSDVKYLDKAIQKIKDGFDICIVSRYLDGAKSYDDDPITSLGNFVFTKLFNFFFKTKLTDLLVMYRAYNKKSLDSLPLDIQIDAWGTQILARAKLKGLRITEIPGNEPKRIGGKRKMQPLKNGFFELITICKEFKERGKNARLN